MALALSGVSAPAWAADEDGKVPHSPVDCWSDLSTGQSLCVPVGDDLAAAVNEATGLHLLEESAQGVSTDLVTGDTYDTPTSSAEMEEISAEVSRAENTTAAVVIAKFYIDANYATGGGVWNISAVGGCYNDSPGVADWVVADFGAVSPQTGYYNNRISSFQSFFSCRTKLWDNANYSGDSIGYSGNLATIGSMNDRANSAKFDY